MKYVSLLSDDKKMKLSFINYNTVIIQDSSFRDVVFNKPIPLLATFDEKMYFWKFKNTEKFPCPLKTDEPIDSGVVNFILKARETLSNDIEELCYSREQFDSEGLDNDFGDF